MEQESTGKPTAALVLGIIGLFVWLLPIIGLPLTIVGVVCGSRGLREPKRDIALAGLILSIIGLVASLVNAAIGAYLGATGKHPWFNGV